MEGIRSRAQLVLDLFEDGVGCDGGVGCLGDWSSYD